MAELDSLVAFSPGYRSKSNASAHVTNECADPFKMFDGTNSEQVVRLSPSKRSQSRQEAPLAFRLGCRRIGSSVSHEFAMDGKQYLAVAEGDNSFSFALPKEAAAIV